MKDETKFWLVIRENGTGMRKCETYLEACEVARGAAGENPDVSYVIFESIASIVKQEFVTRIYKGKRAPVEEELS